MSATPDDFFEQARRLRFDHPGEARLRIEEAACLARAENDRALLGRALAELGRLDRDAGARESSVARYEEAAAMARADGDADALAHRLRHVGDVRVEMGDAAGAAAALDEALVLYRSRAGTAPLDLANMLRSAALHRELDGRRAEAAALWSEAGQLYALAGIEAGVAECRRRAG